MFNDEDSKRRTDQIHENLKRQQQAARDRAASTAQRSPAQVRQQLTDAGYRQGPSRRAGDR